MHSREGELCRYLELPKLEGLNWWQARTDQPRSGFGSLLPIASGPLQSETAGLEHPGHFLHAES